MDEEEYLKSVKVFIKETYRDKWSASHTKDPLWKETNKQLKQLKEEINGR